VFYVFLAVALFAALIFAFARGNRDVATSESAMRLSEGLYAEANMIRAAIQSCTLEFPAGGGDMGTVGGVATPDGVIDADDNPNNPYPINPSSTFNPNAPAGLAAAADDSVRHLTCVGAPADRARIFEGASNQGRFLPPPPQGLSEWVYFNDTDGVRIRITGINAAAVISAFDRLAAKFDSCQAEATAGCSMDISKPRCFTLWIVRKTAC